MFTRSLLTRSLLPLALLLSLLFTGGALAQRVELSPTAGDVTGTVKTRNNKAIPNAVVKVLSGPVIRTARTDAKGVYTLADLPPGAYELLAEKVSYTSAASGRITVAANTAKTIAFKLEWANPSVGGVEVLAQDGSRSPLVDVDVDLIRNGSVVTRGTTDVFGLAVFPGIQPDFYQVAARRPGFPEVRSRNLDVRAGAATAATVTLIADPSRVGSLTGVIRDISNRPVRGAVVRIVTGSSQGQAETQATGEYTLSGLIPGSNYALNVSKSGFAAQILENITVLERRATTLNVTLLENTPTKGSLIGTVKDPDGLPIPFAEVSITSGPDFGQEVLAGENGEYLFTLLTPGTTYAVLAEQTGYTAAGRSGINVIAGVTTRQDLVLQPRTAPTGTLRGFVRDRTSRRLLSGATVEIIRGGSEGRSARTDSGGEYSINGVIAGPNYSIRVSKEEYDSTTVSSILVPVGGTARADAELNPRTAATGSIAGTVTRAGGGPLSNVRVLLFAGPSAPLQEITGTDGTYSFRNIRSGSGYSIRAEGAGSVTQEKRSIVVKDGQTVGVDFKLKSDGQTGGARGQVFDLGRRPVAGARVRVTGGATLPPEVITNAQGEFRFEGLTPGTYTFEASSNGFRPDTRDAVAINRGSTATVNFTLLR